MDGDYYLNRLRHINQELFIIIGELAQDEYAKEQLFKLVPPEERIVQFPGTAPQTNEIKTASINFTKKELDKMPKEFKKEFKCGKIKAAVRKRNNIYEIRCMINGRNISASSKNLAIAKEKFINKLINPQYTKTKTKSKKSELLLENYLIKWLEATRKPYVKENTYKSYLQTVKVDILPKFGDKKITEISTFDIQEHINQYNESGKFRTAHKTYQILNAMFNFAVADNKIQRSPTLKVILGTYEQEHGTALTRAEEKDLLNKFLEAPHLRYRQAFIFIIYTGLRRSELATVELNDKWITVISAKQRKGKKEKTRKIPISPMLKKVLPMINIETIKKTEKNKLTNAFKELCPGHHLHDLRHTFITRCQECYISREMVSIWAGHSTDRSITSTVYTHLEQYEERQLEEIAKFDYEL